MEDWKAKLGQHFNIDPENISVPEEKEKAPGKQFLRVELDKRNGKPATIVSGFDCDEQMVKDIAKDLKVKCGVGGSVRDSEILIQGDLRVKITGMLEKMGHKVKRINF